MVISDASHAELRARIDAHFEWLLVRTDAPAFALQNAEIELSYLDERIHLGFLDDHGFQLMRLNGYLIEDGEISLDVAGAFGRRREKMRLVPRASAAELSAEIELARLRKANDIAEIVADQYGRKIVRVDLAKENGRLAQIFMKVSNGTVGVLADVAGTATHEGLLTFAILWQEKLKMRKKDPAGEVWIVGEKKQAKNLQKLHAMLSDRRKNQLKILELSHKKDGPRVIHRPPRRVRDLWREKCRKLMLPEAPDISGTAGRIIAISPEKIDLIFSKQGETLRFMGLPFARVRRIAGAEKVWFGLERERRILNEATWDSMLALIADLENYRRPDTPNKRHDLYRLAPEAWLESILRRNIKLLDANLILSPIYNQFRASNDKIDLLAIRRDGRLVIVELKTTPDREMVFQAADYWRKIELQRRKGELKRARAFGDMEILDKPALVYTVAPALSFHRDYGFFARTLSKEIELWRFELHESWRDEIKVIARRNFEAL